MLLDDGIIKLRAPEPRDLDTLFIIENDVSMWSDGVTFAPVSRKQLWDYINTYDGNIFATGQLRLVAQEISSDSVVGVVDLYEYDRVNLRAYVGITVVPEYRNQGYGTRILSLIKHYCAAQLGIFMLASIVRADNESSKRIFEKNKFEVTGRFPQWIKKGHQRVDALHMQCILSDI